MNKYVWYFTYGANHLDREGQSLGGCYTPVEAELDEWDDDEGWSTARLTMMGARGSKWSMQYATEDDAGVRKWDLKLVPLEDVSLASKDRGLHFAKG